MPLISNASILWSQICDRGSALPFSGIYTIQRECRRPLWFWLSHMTSISPASFETVGLDHSRPEHLNPAGLLHLEVDNAVLSWNIFTQHLSHVSRCLLWTSHCSFNNLKFRTQKEPTPVTKIVFEIPIFKVPCVIPSPWYEESCGFTWTSQAAALCWLSCSFKSWTKKLYWLKSLNPHFMLIDSLLPLALSLWIFWGPETPWIFAPGSSTSYGGRVRDLEIRHRSHRHGLDGIDLDGIDLGQPIGSVHSNLTSHNELWAR